MSTWTLIGDGPWAQALTHRLAAGGHQITGPDTLAERIIIAVSAEALESTLRALAPRLQGNHRILTRVPGLTPDGHRPGEAVLTLTPVRQVAVLAGGATPETIRDAKPAAVVVASAFPAWASEIQAAFAHETLRIYTETDHAGVELAAALADVLGVALGVARAVMVGPATEATALTRAVAEMDRLVTALGGRAGTAHGLAGLGMLAELAFAGGGESFQAGALLVQGKHAEALARHPDLAHLAQRISERAARQRLRAPLVDTVAALFSGRLPVKEALAGLMARVMRSEKG
jgi:glycerol-3-phosphate dehydrogenase (NAD(P)+)